MRYASKMNKNITYRIDVTFEMAVIYRIKANNGGKKTNVRFSQLVADKECFFIRFVFLSKNSFYAIEGSKKLCDVFDIWL